MIDKQGNKYILQCDYCSNYEDNLEDFQDAIDYKKANDWKSVKIGSEWTDKCCSCVKK